MRSCPGGIYIAPEVVRLLLTVVVVSPQVVHTYLAFVGYQCGVQGSGLRGFVGTAAGAVLKPAKPFHCRALVRVVALKGSDAASPSCPSSMIT